MRRLAVILCLCACSKKPPPPIAATAAFVDVTVVPMDGTRKVAHEVMHQTVLVNGDTIVAIGRVADEVDDHGLPVMITLETGGGTLLVTRSAVGAR